MRGLVACAAGAALALASGCAHEDALTPLPTVTLSPLAEPDARLLLIGDAGRPHNAFLESVGAWLAAHVAPTTVAFLGDNFYPVETSEMPEVIAAQVRVARAPADVVFTAGNHDWHPRGARLFDRASLERISRLATLAGAAWQPPPGVLGPAIVAPPHGLFRVVAIDSERWRLASRRCELGRDTECEAVHHAEAALGAALACATCAPAILIAHHPLRTNGVHGGCETPWLRDFLSVGGQDMRARPYRAYLRSVGGVLAKHPPLLFAAGHDHSLQWLRDERLGALVVSGSGAQTSAVCTPPGAPAWRRRGFMAVDFARGAAPLLRGFAVDDRGTLQEVLRERLAP